MSGDSTEPMIEAGSEGWAALLAWWEATRAVRAAESRYAALNDQIDVVRQELDAAHEARRRAGRELDIWAAQP